MKTLILALIFTAYSQVSFAQIFECQSNDKKIEKITAEVETDNGEFSEIRYTVFTPNNVYSYYQSISNITLDQYRFNNKTDFYTDAFPRFANNLFGRLIIRVEGNKGAISGLNFRKNPDQDYGRKRIYKTSRWVPSRIVKNLECTWF